MKLVRPHWFRGSLLAFVASFLVACQASPVPVADFSATVTSGRASLTVQFTDLSTEDPTEWTWDFGDGTTSTDQHPTHEYTATGTYQVTLLATRDEDTSEQPKTLVITVEPGPVDRVELSPATTRLAVQGEQRYSIRVFDAFGNEVLTLAPRWQVTTKAGTIDQQGSFKASTTAGDYPASVEVEIIDGDVTRRATASVTVLPGGLDRVEISPKSITVQAGESHQYVALAYDRFDNEIADADLRWQVITEAGTISSTGRFSATQAGESTEAILVEARQDDVTKSDHAAVTVMPGPPSRVEVSPAHVLLLPRASQQLTATVFDELGNEISEPTLHWEVIEGANIHSTGLLTAGTRVGDFEVTVTVGTADEQGIAEGTTTLTVEPDALERVEIAPRPATVIAGRNQRFTAIAYDAFGNEIPGVTLRWRARAEAGRIDPVGVFSASTKAGMHADAVTVEAIEGYISKIDRITVAIETGSPAIIEVRPSPVTVVPGQTQTFTATVFDLHRNEIRETTITWKVVGGGGTIDAAGVFTAGEELGTYSETILVEADYQGAKATIKVTITVAEYLPGKILFNATHEGDTDIYVMDPDGSNLTRLTSGGTTNHHAAWSPDGTQIVFTSWRDGNAEIYIMDADGSNQVRLTDNTAFDAWPDWSSTEDRIAFTSTRIIGGFDIFVMDADGSNLAQLTVNRRFDSDLRPYWSPDGKMILYASDEGNEFDLEVWVMNADGTNKQQLTDNQAVDVGVSWYPDGSKILFLSDQDGQVDLDLYIMNPDGSDVVRLTLTPTIWEELSDYSPDGTRIVFLNFLDDQIWVMDADGRNPASITEDLFLSGYPQWQPVAEAPVLPLIIGGAVLTDADLEGPGDHFPLEPSSTHLPEEDHYTEYNTLPPTSGPHWSRAAPWGIYASPIANERQVSNLAQGGIVIQYRTEDQQLISQLEDFVRAQQDFPCHLILAPYTDMPFTIAITAWGVRDTMDEFDEAQLQEFVDFYRGNGPEAAECTP